MTVTRKIQLSLFPLDDLLTRARSENPKGHELAAITDSLGRFGYMAPPLVNDADGKLLAGHGRLEALARLRSTAANPPSGIEVAADGAWLVPALHGFDLQPDEALAYLVADNRTVELGGWDESQLGTLLAQISSSASGLDGVGFSPLELDELLQRLGQTSTEESHPDDVPDPPEDDACYVQTGDLWHLGGHRLLCGDSTLREDVGRLLAGRKADLLFTDPPYNVAYGRHSGASRGRRRAPIANDDLSEEDWHDFLLAWTRHLSDVLDGEAYVFMSSKELPLLATLLADAGLHWSDTIIWAKDSFTLGRADYQHQYEPIWYGWPRGAKRHWCGLRDQGNVWTFPRPRVSELHPTAKPVALIERALHNSASRGAIVLDLFAGSGSTLIAAERLGLHCHALELEPRFVQVIIERWQSFSGRKAEKEESPQ